MSEENERKTLGDLQTEFTHYRQDFAEKLLPHLEMEQEQYATCTEGLFEFYMLMSFLPDRGHLHLKEEGLQTLFAKTSQDLYGVFLCLRGGSLTLAATGLRAVFETLLNVRVITETDVAQRLALFVNYRVAMEWRHLDGWMKLLAKGATTQQEFDARYSKKDIHRIQSQYAAVRNDYGKKRPIHWAWKIYGRKPSVWLLCERFGLEQEYFLYSALSTVVHSGATSQHFVDDGQAIHTAPVLTPQTCKIAWMCAHFAAEICKALVEYSEHSQQAEIIAELIDGCTQES